MKKKTYKHCNGLFETWNGQNVGGAGLLIADKTKNQHSISQYNADMQ